VLAAVSLSVAGLAGPARAGGATAPLAVGRLTAWTACGSGLQCAVLPVPLDYARPGAGTINLAVIRRPARLPKRRLGSLVYLEGGPGVSGVASIRSYPDLFDAAVRDRFDIVGFDQRGVGASAPVRCLTDAQKASQLADVIPGGVSRAGGTRPAAVGDVGGDGRGDVGGDVRGDVGGDVGGDGRGDAGALAGFAGAALADSEVARGCERLSGRLLPYLSTALAARDVDLLRAALGEPRLTAYGSSYGTELGATYAALFPGRIRALVLDSISDPRLSMTRPFDEIRLQAQGFEAAMDAFLSACRRDAACPFGHGDPAGAYDRLMARLARHPIYARGNDADRTRPVDATLATYAVMEPLYAQRNWPVLAAALARADNDDGSVLLALADLRSGRRQGGAYDNSFDANTAINCADQAYPTDLAAFRRFAADLAREAPRFGPSMALGGLACAFWPVRAVVRYTGPFRAQGAPPILLVGTTGDPVTPYTEATSLAAQLADSVLLTWHSFSHGAYAGPSTCVHAAVDRYLLATVPPRRGTVCS
jgi:pimeloyl-ACP methyl ester carboxylesterase